MNLLSLVTPWLDNVCQIKTKYYSSQKQKILRTKQGLNKALLPLKNPNIFQNFSSRQIFRRIHEILNIDESKN